MKKIVLISLVLMCCSHVIGQVIFISTTNNRIYRLDIESCNYVEVVRLNRSLTDISFHPDGTFYGLSNNGNLFEIDTISGATNMIYDFGGQVYNSLTISADGTIYATGDVGALWTYDKINNQATLHGLIGYRPTGDLTFFKGNLYVATENDRIVKIDINDPSNSVIAVDGNISGEIFGIVSYSRSCDSINCYAISSGNSNIYEINFPNKTLQLVCSLNIRVGGGASTYEFYGSAPVIYNGVTTIDPTCNHADGSIMINVSGGIPPLTYSLDGVNYQLSNTFDHLNGGQYQFIVSDANGCTIIEEASLASINGPVIDNIATIPTTCDQTNGEITVLVHGGNGTISYSIDGINFQSSEFFNNLSPGLFTITVKDTAGCSVIDNSEIIATQPVEIDAVTFTSSSCSSNTGFLIVNAHAGSQIHYSIDGSIFQDTAKFDNLASGIYHVTVLDDNGCSDTFSINIVPAPPLFIDQITSVDPLCNEQFGSVRIETNGGTGNIQFSIDGVHFQSENHFDQLAPGQYYITIQDRNGCSDTASIVIHSGVPLNIEEIVGVAPRCDVDDGSIVITSSGGSGQIEYTIDGIVYQNSNQFLNLGTGLYTVGILDSAGCSAIEMIELKESPSVSIKNVETQPTECGESNGMIEVETSGGTGLITISLDGGPFLINTLFQNQAAGNHTLHIRDEYGCFMDTIIRVGQLRCEIYIPNTFSPNQDGINDYFFLSTSGDYNVVISKYLIFDRWGDMVYSDGGFLLSSNEHWWDGTYKKMSMSPGVFAYYIEVEYDDGGKEIFKGGVTLIR